MVKVALQSILTQFLQLLARDFKSWSARDPSRRRISGGGLLAASSDSSSSATTTTTTTSGSVGNGSRDKHNNATELAGGIPKKWQPCDRDGEPVSVSEVN